MYTPSSVLVRGRFRSSFMRSCVVPLVNDWREDSSTSEVDGIGLGSKAARLPKSNDNGIAFIGFTALRWLARSREVRIYVISSGPSSISYNCLLMVKVTSDKFFGSGFSRVISRLPKRQP